MFKTGRILRPATLKSGHCHVYMSGEQGGRYEYIHRLVLEAFAGECPSGHEACHWNDVPDDNRIENLRWAPRRDNNFDRWRNGRRKNQNDGATHCKHGHEFTPENTRVSKDGHRECKTCKNERQRKRRKANRSTA